jgi:hypothetical protein
MSNALLAWHGVGTVWRGVPDQRQIDGVAADLEAARARQEKAPAP